jgi:hypothetical protein
MVFHAINPINKACYNCTKLMFMLIFSIILMVM